MVNELHVYSPHVLACLSRGKIAPEISTEPPRSKARLTPVIKREAADLKQSLLLEPKNVSALTELGMIYLNAGDYHQANLLFSKALELKADDSYLINREGICLYHLNRHQEAAMNFEFALQKLPNNTQAGINLIHIQLRYKNTEAARHLAKTLKGASRLDANNPDLILGALESFNSVRP